VGAECKTERKKTRTRVKGELEVRTSQLQPEENLCKRAVAVGDRKIGRTEVGQKKR
jgi:hypothetical protein